jgi:hypothetical protein
MHGGWRYPFSIEEYFARHARAVSHGDDVSNDFPFIPFYILFEAPFPKLSFVLPFA